MPDPVTKVNLGPIQFGGGNLVFIAGPCVIESREVCLEIADRVVEIARRLNVQYVFKASFDKANRTSISSFRGPGLDKGLEILQEIKDKYNVPVTTDIHESWQAKPAAEVVDIIQIPAFLCRQTDLLLAAASTGKIVNVKKAQFLAPEDMANVVKKIEITGNRSILLTERGTSFGYHTLIVDMRGLSQMRALGYPVIFDATHSVQRPGGNGTTTGGDRKMVPVLARAAVGAGCDGIFMETHVDPDHALSDAANSMAVSKLEATWKKLVELQKVVHE